MATNASLRVDNWACQVGLGLMTTTEEKKKNPKQTWITMSPNKLLKYDKFDYLMTYFLWTVVKISAWLKLN